MGKAEMNSYDITFSTLDALAMYPITPVQRDFCWPGSLTGVGLPIPLGMV
jgi:hypothetical protein